MVDTRNLGGLRVPRSPGVTARALRVHAPDISQEHSGAAGSQMCADEDTSASRALGESELTYGRARLVFSARGCSVGAWYPRSEADAVGALPPGLLRVPAEFRILESALALQPPARASAPPGCP